MINRIKTYFLGARTVKTGIAVGLSIFLSGYVPHSLPLLAGLAAVICMQPSLSAGIKKGFARIQTTIIAGLFGLAFYFALGANVITISLAVILLIALFNKLKWEENTVLAASTVTAILSEVTGNVFYYALGRVSSTLVGIGVATIINMVLVPPRHKPAFHKKLDKLTAGFTALYIKTVDAFATGRGESAAQVLEDLSEAKSDVVNLRQELNHLKTGSESFYGAYLEGIKRREAALFEQGVGYLEDGLARMHKMVRATQSCRQHNLDLMRSGKAEGSEQEHLEQQNSGEQNKEFEALIYAIYELVRMLGELHRCVFELLDEEKREPSPLISRDMERVDSLKEQLRQRLKEWQGKHIQELDIVSIMCVYRIVFDLEEITDSLTKLAGASNVVAE